MAASAHELQPKGARLEQNGLVLQVGALANLLPCTLRYAGAGSRLFATRDTQWASALCELMADMLSGRLSYEAGVTQERLRIGRDLHDNISARPLEMIHQLRGTREAMKDLRTSIAVLDSHPVALVDALADWRAEASERCEAAGSTLQWEQQTELDSTPLKVHTKATLEAVVRELLTNALKHAAPTQVSIAFAMQGERLQCTLTHDGAVSAPDAWQDGYGMRNVRARLNEKGGTLMTALRDQTLLFHAEIPVT